MARKLTDIDRVILAAAAARESGLVLPLPVSLGDDRPRLEKVLQKLVERGAITERPKLPEEDTWQTREDGEKVVLVITPTGLQLVGIEALAHVEPETSARACPAARSKTTVAGSRTKKQSNLSTVGATKPASPKVADTPEPNAPRAGTKLAALIAALSSPQGATIAELVTTTGWQAHSIRGAMSGALKKKLSLDINSAVEGERGRVYRIIPGKGQAGR